ncbi:HMG box domain-containing protein [Mycena sanguinolenta]|uniref:HMG box domain-containing protein n=1 Tax=Mycena sanguinolenta TaxID=230812 RepID=A0A8H6Y2S2_9AGAR|nr:HMG box domain-containing protein [Mycena sanguinolenta]
MPVVRRTIAYRKSRRLRNLDDDDSWEPYDAAMLDSALPPSPLAATEVKAERAVPNPEPESEPEVGADTDREVEGEQDTDQDADSDPNADAALDAELDARYGVEFPNVKPGGHVPRPRNAFICFRSVYVARHREQVHTGAASNYNSTSASDLALDRLVGLSHPASTSTSSSGTPPTRTVNQTVLSSDAGDTWRAFSPARRAPFQRMALREKEKHARTYPWYRYAPGAGGGVVRKPKPKLSSIPTARPTAEKLKPKPAPKFRPKSASTHRRCTSISISTSPAYAPSTSNTSDPCLDAFFKDTAADVEARQRHMSISDAKKRKYSHRASRKNADEDEMDSEYKPDLPRSKSKLRKTASASSRPRRVSWASPIAKMEKDADAGMEMPAPSLNTPEEQSKKPDDQCLTDDSTKLDGDAYPDVDMLESSPEPERVPAPNGEDKKIPHYPADSTLVESSRTIAQKNTIYTNLRASSYDLSPRNFGLPSAAPSPFETRTTVDNESLHVEDIMDIDSEDEVASLLPDDVSAAARFCASLRTRSLSPPAADLTQMQTTAAEVHDAAMFCASLCRSPSPLVSFSPPATPTLHAEAPASTTIPSKSIPAPAAPSRTSTPTRSPIPSPTHVKFEWDSWIYTPLELPDELDSEAEEQRFAPPAEDFGFFYPFDLEGGVMNELQSASWS